MSTADPGSGKKPPNNYLLVAFDHDAIVWTRMVRPLSVPDVGDGTSDATRIRVVFAGAFDPCSRTFNVDLARSLVEPEGDAWDHRERVLLVGAVLHTSGKH